MMISLWKTEFPENTKIVFTMPMPENRISPSPQEKLFVCNDEGAFFMLFS
jgi:hypothetical protein